MTFLTYENAQKACNIQFETDNEHTLQIWNKDKTEDVHKHALVIKDIPLNVNRSLLNKIISQYGETNDIKYRLSGIWYTATAYFKDKQSVS